MGGIANLRRRAYRRVGILIDAALFERRLGVDTAGVMTMPEHSETSEPYEAVRWLTIAKDLKELDLTRDDVLLDSGCGKGRIVLRAALAVPLRKAVGFDISPELVQVAQRNVEAVRGRLKCKDVELCVGDSGQWTVADDVTVVVASNPFSGEVLDRFLAQIVASADRNSRRLRLLYLWPHYSDAVERTGRFRRLWAREPTHFRPGAHLYEVT